MDGARWDPPEDSPVLLPLDVLRLRLIAFVLAFDLVIAIFAGFWLHASEHRAETRAASLSASLAELLEANLAGVIGKIDLALHAIVDEAERQLTVGDIDARRFDAYILREQARLPEVETLRAANAEGLSIYGANLPVVTTRSIVGREYFTLLRDTRTDDLVFSDPLVGGITGETLIMVARRIDGPDGSFAGLASAGVGLAKLTKSFASFDIGPGGSIELRDHALAVMAASNPGSGTLDLADGKKVRGKTVSIRKIGTYPLYVVVTLDRRDFLAPWYATLTILLASLLAMVAASIIIALMFYRRAQRARMAAHALARQEFKYRTIADFTYDWEFWIDTEGAFTYVSPSCERITGFKPSEFYLNSDFFLSIVHPDDREAYLRHQHLAGPDSGFSTTMFRIRRADGEIRWIEHLCRPIVSAVGEWMGTRGSNRDISDRREAEDRIRALLGEKDLILKEVHHRIKNNMTIVSSLLDMQSGSAREAEVADALHTAANRIRSMALLYDKLYRAEAGNAASLREYLTSLLLEIHGTFPERETVALSLDLVEVSLDSVRLSRIGIILNELLTNSMKHAFRGRTEGSITVSALREGSILRIEYADDGRGFPPSEASAPDQAGFGLVLISSLARQLKGRVELSGEKGFRYSISMEV